MLTAAAVARAWAQEPDTTELARLRAQIETITRELEELRLGREVVAQADTAMYGLGPAASKVYRVRQGVSLAGYGEMLYENFAGTRQDGTPSGHVDRLDFLRGIVYLGYKFDERFLFNSEIEFEHGSTDKAGSVSFEFAYVDYRLSQRFGLRAGLLLIPLGLINELHEPPIFLGTARPETEQRLIPTTWRENGIGVFGSSGDVAYRAYVITGLDAVGGGFSAGGLRGGRQKGSKALAEDLAVVARLDYTGVLGLTVGVSGYVGESGQNAPSPGKADGTIGARTLIWDAHAEYRAYGLDLRGLFAMAAVGDVAALNAARQLSGAASIGERLVGWYVHGGYDVLRGVRTGHQLIPYVRYERLNTQDRVPSGFATDPANDRRIIAVGAAWKPIANIVVKADYQVHRNAADTGVNQLNFQLGYLF